eukprot:GHVN01049930.1.p1 GENE.GHVN01049930.1~~GHVN01049930.1.p1  ORF type:complete len:1042 (-),score=86.04 GHVN01049930.1:701-3433(-)
MDAVEPHLSIISAAPAQHPQPKQPVPYAPMKPPTRRMMVIPRSGRLELPPNQLSYTDGKAACSMRQIRRQVSREMGGTLVPPGFGPSHLRAVCETREAPQNVCFLRRRRGKQGDRVPEEFGCPPCMVPVKPCHPLERMGFDRSKPVRRGRVSADNSRTSTETAVAYPPSAHFPDRLGARQRHSSSQLLEKAPNPVTSQRVSQRALVRARSHSEINSDSTAANSPVDTSSDKDITHFFCASPLPPLPPLRPQSGDGSPRKGVRTTSAARGMQGQEVPQGQIQRGASCVGIRPVNQVNPEEIPDEHQGLKEAQTTTACKQETPTNSFKHNNFLNWQSGSRVKSWWSQRQTASPNCVKAKQPVVNERVSRYLSSLTKKKQGFMSERRDEVELDLRRWKTMHGIDSKRKVFITCGSVPSVRKALLDRGWAENPDKESNLYDLRWFSHTSPKFNTLSPFQVVNRFSGTGSLTTKSGLLQSLRNETSFRLDISTDQIIARSYDLGSEDDVASFIDHFKLLQCEAVLKSFILQELGDDIEAASGKTSMTVDKGGVRIPLPPLCNHVYIGGDKLEFAPMLDSSSLAKRVSGVNADFDDHRAHCTPDDHPECKVNNCLSIANSFTKTDKDRHAGKSRKEISLKIVEAAIAVAQTSRTRLFQLPIFDDIYQNAELALPPATPPPAPAPFSNETTHVECRCCQLPIQTFPVAGSYSDRQGMKSSDGPQTVTLRQRASGQSGVASPRRGATSPSRQGRPACQGEMGTAHYPIRGIRDDGNNDESDNWKLLRHLEMTDYCPQNSELDHIYFPDILTMLPNLIKTRKDNLKTETGQHQSRRDELTKFLLRAHAELQSLMNLHYHQFHANGESNTWIVKPACKSRGRDIKVMRDLDEILRFATNIRGQRPDVSVARRFICQNGLL